MQILQKPSKIHQRVCAAATKAAQVNTPMTCSLHRSSSRSRTSAARVLRSTTHLHCANFSGGATHSSQPASLPANTITSRRNRLVCRDSPFVGDTAPTTATPHNSMDAMPPAYPMPLDAQNPEARMAITAAQMPQIADLLSTGATIRAVTSNSSSSAVNTAAANGNGSAVFDPDAANPNYNKSGLNGLTAGSTTGLETGSFTVTSQMPVRYTVQEVPGLLSPTNKNLLRGVVPGSFPFALGPEPELTTGLRRLVIIDDNVERLYGQQLRQYFEHHGVEYRLLALPTCEANKNFELVEAIAEAMEEFKINRRQDPVIAIGGGVCLDVAGLAANLYRRHTGLIKVPTTVMAVVDASIGIKTAVNFHDKKNKLGTYCPPLGVFYDTSFLTTLDDRHISNGAAEILKMACIKDRELFELLEVHANDVMSGKFQGPAAATIIRRSIQGMLEELEYNLWEAILCRLVDYGHTVSPELEMAALRSPDMLLHGEAVAIDMALSTELAYNRGLLTSHERNRVLQLMLALRLPLWHESCNPQLFMKGLDDMTRARDGLQRVPLMSGIGAAVFINDITAAEMAAATDQLLHFAAANGCNAAVEAANKHGHRATKNNIIPLHPAGVKTRAYEQLYAASSSAATE